MEPLKASNFSSPDFNEYLTHTIDVRAPRLIVMECPAKHWYQCTSNKSYKENSARQKEKKIREALTPFLKTVEEVSERQLKDGKDFVIELPLTKEVLRHPTAKEICKKEDVQLAQSNKTWWMTSSTQIAEGLDLQHNSSRRESWTQAGTALAVMNGLECFFQNHS